MNQGFLTVERIASGLLVAGLLVGLVALFILFTSGAFHAFSAVLRGSLEQMAPYAATFRGLTLLWTIGWIVQLLGFGLLTYLLLRAGDQYLSIIAFIAVLVATILGVLHGTFHMSVDPWAAQEAARTGSIPEVYKPLEAWIENSFKLAYIVHLIAMIIFGWVLLHTGLLGSWVAWTVMVWSLLWIIGGLAGVGIPGILFIMPAVIGLALLWR